MDYWRILMLLHLIAASLAYREDSQYNDLAEEGRHGGRRRRPGSQNGSPCNFAGSSGKPKSQPQGRTFFDLQFLNLEHNYNYNINCGSGGGSYPAYPQPAPVYEILPGEDGGHKPGGHKPSGGGGGGNKPFNRPGKPGGGGGGSFNNHGGGGGGGGGPFGGNNRPQRPFQGGHSQQSSSVADSSDSGQQNGGPGVFSGAFAGFFPSPQQFATGLSDGIQSFVGTIPAIGQSFQSILPSFSDFQLPQLPQFNPGDNTGPVTFAPLFQGFNPSSSTNNFNRPPVSSAPIATTLSPVSSTPFTTTTDPDDVIYSDELKPVHEDYDPITDPYISNKLPPGVLTPGQYLVVSNPHLGSYTHDISAFNPTNLYNKLQQGVMEALDEFGSFF
ncbi:keratin, type I cytoskeletal 9 [Dendroctonus ponderosae]|uniref:keratin, type I cytoskeletal 9 n=1 Tax=Dendroctonus ponderosae TaxID=77166 RepID=UPI0020355565|nr:keratin, type I cytoskeletal 9 [Dendroctonus ponderosae]